MPLIQTTQVPLQVFVRLVLLTYGIEADLTICINKLQYVWSHHTHKIIKMCLLGTKLALQRSYITKCKNGRIRTLLSIIFSQKVIIKVFVLAFQSLILRKVSQKICFHYSVYN